jgi:propanol-preferring alcohol dehydrogenase
MKAIQLEEGELHVRDVDVPEPGPDQARVHLSASGVCHSDLHLARGDWMGLPNTMPLGHEGIGVVETLGPGAERYVAVGDRVILGLGGMGGGYWCGACEYCLSGRPRLCAQSQPLMGTFAEQLCVWAPALVRIPDSLGDEDAPLACGGLTAFSAVRKLVGHGVPPGRTIAIIGAAGGLGHYAVQIAHAFGYRVVGVDVGEDRLEFVRSLGAEHVVSADDAAGFGLRVRPRRGFRRAGVRGAARRLRTRPPDARSGRPVRRGGDPAVERRQSPAAPVADVPHRPDDHLLGGRDGAGDA